MLNIIVVATLFLFIGVIIGGTIQVGKLLDEIEDD